MKSIEIFQAERYMEYLECHFPRILTVIPPEAEIFYNHEIRCGGRSTHPEVVQQKWLIYNAEYFSADSTVPNDFFFAGIKIRPNAEAVCLMWKREERTFWFSEIYVVFMGGGDNAARMEKVKTRLNSLIERWEDETGDIHYERIP